MKVEVKIDPNLSRPRAVIYAPAATPEVLALAERLRKEEGASPFTAFRESEAVLIQPGDILRFFTDGKGATAFASRRYVKKIKEAVGL